jgi:serine/threonine-protein kinase
MELLKGETLEDRLRRDKVIGARELTRILRQVAVALDEAHSLGIIHRDVKPANVFMLAGKGEVRTKMLDFGMAKRTGISNPSVVTEAGTSVGTPDYMSPEQLRTAHDVDHRSDLWAVGVMAYRALIGRLPFVSTTFAGLCMAICVGRYIRPSELAPFLGATVDRWFERALAVDRKERFHSAGEMVEALERALAVDSVPPPRPAEREPTSAPASGEPSPAARSSHRWLDVAVVLMLTLAALCGGALLASLDGF